MRWMDGLFGKRKREKELEEEVRSHLKLSAQERVVCGVAEGEATSAARREFGNVELVKETTRDAWGWRFLDRPAQDLRFGLRMIVKSPGFAAVAILTLALGIGANTALFSVVNAVLLNPLPYPDPDQLLAVYSKTGTFQESSISYPNFLDWQKDNHSFAALSAFRSDDYNMVGAGEPERVHIHMISAEFFPALGLQPVLGRMFRPEEDRAGAGPVTILGDGLWKRKFGLSPDVLGQ